MLFASNDKKQTLLEMARRGADKPSYTSKNEEERNLGRYFYDCTYKTNSKSYDLEFANQIRKLRPDWIITRTDKAAKRKQEIIKMAKEGKNKPPILREYLIEGPRYDNEFLNILKDLRPDWFGRKLTVYKKTLLEMAIKGKNKPMARSKDKVEKKLGQALQGYINESQGVYDEDLKDQIFGLRPDWFVDHKKVLFEEKKQKLLQMARNNENKPNINSNKKEEKSLALSFMKLTRPLNRMYNEEFVKQIQEIRPDWLINKATLNIILKKKKLLEMAKNGESKPHRYNENVTYEEKKLAILLQASTCETGKFYDEEFAKEIKKLRPEWFDYPIKDPIGKKKKLFEMAKNGENKPSIKINGILYIYFKNFINKSQKGYDEEFVNQLKAIRPDWFDSKLRLTSYFQNKQKLLEFAKSGENKPRRYAKNASKEEKKLANFLRIYTNKSSHSYDEEFVNQLKAIRPDWFLRKRNNA